MIEFTPWDDGGGGLRMGLSPLAADRWLQRPHDWAARLQQRQLLLQSRRHEVFARLPGSHVDDAQMEVAALIHASADPANGIPEHEINRVASTVGADAGLPADACFLRAGLSVCEDLCVLLPSGDDYRLHSALLCAPSFWFLQQKLGLSLPGIHAPVVGLEEKLGARIRAFLANLPPERVFTRGNWHLHNTGEQFHPHPDDWTKAHTLTPDNIGQRLWLRCERQTLRKLTHSGAILFTILVYVNPLAELALHPTLARELWRAYMNMPTAERDARHFAAFNAPLQQCLERVTLPI